MFTRFGSVFEIQEHPSRPDVTYVVSVVAMETSYWSPTDGLVSNTKQNL